MSMIVPVMSLPIQDLVVPILVAPCRDLYRGIRTVVCNGRVFVSPKAPSLVGASTTVLTLPL